MKIIFFDGNCPMCHSWVKRIILWDKKKRFKFSPLESELAKKTLTPILPDYVQEDTIIYYDEGRVYLRSTAALKIFEALNFPYKLGIAGWLIPKPWRDALYRWVAARRYKYGERYERCPLPPPEWKNRFL